ncbi:23S rRNA (adenine(2030)-N(6))-methyltransferase RlmJ [Methylothermus subterraneus]
MLSYRHAFHAGNHADVLKHWLVVEILSYLNAKETPWAYIDTHAGGGVTDLNSEYARKLCEFQTGIGRLWRERALAPAGLATYLKLVEDFNPGGALSRYPGSGALAQRLARPGDRLHLFELHPADYLNLTRIFAHKRRVHCYREDGFTGLLGVLPPPSRRGVILIDPSYEVERDWTRVSQAVRAARARFPQGIYLIWYPRLAKAWIERMVRALVKLAADDYFKAELIVRRPPRGGAGMFGSGVLVLNPPWTLPACGKEVLPWLAARLAQDKEARYELEYHVR